MDTPNMEAMLSALLNKLEKMDAKLDANMKSVDARFDALEGRMDFVEDRLHDLTIEVRATDNRVKSLGDNFDDFKGRTNERILRDEVKRRYGEHFCRPFVVQGLSGLVRLTLASKRSESPYFPRDPGSHSFADELSDVQRQTDGVKKLTDAIFSGEGDVKAFRMWLEKLLDRKLTPQEESAFSKATLRSVQVNSNNKEEVTKERDRRTKLKKDFEAATAKQKPRVVHPMWNYVLKQKLEQLNAIQGDSGCGLTMLMATIPALEKYFPIIDLEFDCRGSIEYMEDSIIITAGEIKSSYCSVSRAKDQLDKRLAALDFVCQQFELKEASKGKNAKQKSLNKKSKQVIKRGIVFLPVTEFDKHRQSSCPPASEEFHLELEYV
jgi:hypothetical protein